MKNRAFTLIEVLVVVLIIGILAAIAIPKYLIATEKSRYMQLIVQMRAIKEAQELYYLANGEYTTNLDALDIKLPYSNIHYVYHTEVREDSIFVYDLIRGSKTDVPRLWVYYDHASSAQSPMKAGKAYCYGYGEAAKVCASVGKLAGKHPYDALLNIYEVF